MTMKNGVSIHCIFRYPSTVRVLVLKFCGYILSFNRESCADLYYIETYFIRWSFSINFERIRVYHIYASLCDSALSKIWIFRERNNIFSNGLHKNVLDSYPY
jgi:hypothetical protein